MAARTFDVPAARSAFTRYRVMAWITGVMLLLLCLEMVLKYVFQAGGVDANGDALPVIGAWVPMAHGFVYMVYLLAAFDMWARVRWGLGRMVVLALGGVIPVMSFVVEHVANGWFKADVESVVDANPAQV